jgi:hypothetical protein
VAAFIQAQQATSKKNAEAPFHFFHHKRLISPNKIRVESKILPQKLGIFQEIIAICLCRHICPSTLILDRRRTAGILKFKTEAQTMSARL